MIIAIDGTSSSGKSSIAKELGRRLGFHVLGTGSLYRAVALKMLNLSIDLSDDEMIKTMLSTSKIESHFENGVISISIDGIDTPMSTLNSQEVSALSAEVAQKPFVREFIRSIQHAEAEKHQHIIVEGRDIGSVVFPDAEIKLYIDADIVTRAKRKQATYHENGEDVKLEEVIRQLEQRDKEDRERDISPLIMTSTSIFVDTSAETLDQSVNKIIDLISEIRNK